MENPEHREVIWQSSKLRTKVYVSLEDLRKLAAEFSANDPHVHIDVLSDNCLFSMLIKKHYQNLTEKHGDELAAWNLPRKLPPCNGWILVIYADYAVIKEEYNRGHIARFLYVAPDNYVKWVLAVQKAAKQTRYTGEQLRVILNKLIKIRDSKDGVEECQEKEQVGK